MGNWWALCGMVSDAAKEEMLGDSVLVNGIDCRTGNKKAHGKQQTYSLGPRENHSSSSLLVLLLLVVSLAVPVLHVRLLRRASLEGHPLRSSLRPKQLRRP